MARPRREVIPCRRSFLEPSVARVPRGERAGRLTLKGKQTGKPPFDPTQYDGRGPTFVAPWTGPGLEKSPRMESGSMKQSAKETALGYLESHNVMTLATHGPEGLWAAAVFYVSEGFRLYFLSAKTTRHARNLAENPRVAATIQEDYRDWLAIRGIQLEGVCRRLDGEESSSARSLYEAKFPLVGADAPLQIARALEKVAWYEVTPERAFFIDNSVSLGHRDEIPLDHSE